MRPNLLMCMVKKTHSKNTQTTSTQQKTERQSSKGTVQLACPIFSHPLGFIKNGAEDHGAEDQWS